jgi:hypothetical protein
MIELMTDYSKRWLNFQQMTVSFQQMTKSPLQTTDSLQQMNYTDDKIYTMDEWILQQLTSEAYPDLGSGAFLTSRSGIWDG